MMFRTKKRAFAFAPFLAAVALITACDDDPVAPPDPGEAVEAIRLTVGNQTIDLPDTDAVTIPLGATNVSATFLDADGNAVEGLDEFELLIETEGAEDVVTFDGSGSDPFAGTLTGESAGTASVEVQLYHTEEGHEDFSASLNVTVE